MARCPICGKTKQKKIDIINHVEEAHGDEIPNDMSTAQFIYKLNNGRDYGLCRVCKKPTSWNEKTGKPHQICDNLACRKKLRDAAKSNMIKIYGKETLLNDIDHQSKMLANRKISGIYKWSDNIHKFIYTGSYEKFAIEWLDKVMELDPDTISMPGPIVYYDFEGKKKPWITDIYLSDFNLIIEIKDGSFDKNTHPGFAHNRELEKAKDNYMKKQNKYNYIKLTNKNMLPLIKIISMIRENNIFEVSNDNYKPSVVIQESATNNSNEGFTINTLSNDELDKLSESVKLDVTNETMGVVNLSPIVGSSKGVLEEKNEDVEDSTMMFGDGIYSSIVDKNSPYNFRTINEDNENERKLKLSQLRKILYSDKINNYETDQMFSEHEKETFDPFSQDSNFIENENGEIRVDINNGITDFNERDSLLGDIYKSNFIVKE